MHSIRHKQRGTANTKGGYSLVEVLVAITVLLIALVGPLTIAQVGLKRALNSREQTMSVFLAQEGIETLFKLREDSALSAFPSSLNNLSLVWGYVSTLANRCTVANPCGVQIGTNGVINTASFYNCNSSNCKMRYDTTAAVPYRQGVLTGVETIYERKLVISVDNDKAIIKSTVSWGTKPEQQVSLETYVYNIYYEPPM
ncbi:hypothetical protein A2392_00385 [Candidatus Kaiserbacteria bacterium RIFOXYB1_FULL_46_14]|uniref:Type IV pilus modification protein PilV n=1 Tax=Candidatus Kaiserbacteria bacterium RIFOXYB1_FULL_46_14 TaxID=1798531 RepID=A0A1F6FJ24_9BACT|nr:MAG: hypothetical protein A2392_00385 [Candidatus Kaiserbacteria bacterium RIFOXYB1_FULL_46_14]